MGKRLQKMTTQLAAVLAGVSMASTTLAAPPVHSAEECILFGDMALVARAMAEEGIAKQRTHQVLDRIYLLTGDRTRTLAQLVLDAAYRESAPASEYATRFVNECAQRRGNMDTLLGPTA